MATGRMTHSGFAMSWFKEPPREKRETVEEWEARGNKIEKLPPEATSGNPLNEWRSSYDDES